MGFSTEFEKIYQLCYGKGGNIIDQKLILNNHSRVLYDYDLIPQDQIITNDES